MAKKTFDEMTPVERMRHWMDIVSGAADSGDDDYQVKTVTESADKTQVTIIIKKEK